MKSLFTRFSLSKPSKKASSQVLACLVGSIPSCKAWIRQSQPLSTHRIGYRVMLASQSYYTNLRNQPVPHSFFQKVLSHWKSTIKLSQFPVSNFWSKTRCCTVSVASCSANQKQKKFSPVIKPYIQRYSPKEKLVMEDEKLQDVYNFMESLKNYEKEGIPNGAGTDSEEGFDLQRMERLIQLLGDPLSKYQVVHIAGTKGKGSTSAFISNILREEGYSVGVYTSPHLKTIRERIVTGKNCEIMSADALKNLFDDVKHMLKDALEVEGLCLTHFEVFTALAFKFFADQNVDIAVIEAGLGGARDATNIIKSEGLLASVITTIGEEHLEALGGSLENIAFAKSGIIKQGRPVVLGSRFEFHIEQILRNRAALLNAPIISSCAPGIKSCISRLDCTGSIPYQYVDISINLDEKNPNLMIDLAGVKIGMLGNHQLQNAITAICTSLCLREQGLRISDKSIITGLEKSSLLGRFQVLTPVEAESLGVVGSTIILDGAHTTASAKALADTIRMVYPDKPLAYVVSMANDKDHSGFARELISGTTPKVALFRDVSVAGSRSRTMPASLLTDTWTQIASEMMFSVTNCSNMTSKEPNKHSSTQSTIVISEEVGSVEIALRKANDLLNVTTNSGGIICVTGSLHAISEIICNLHN